MKKEEFLQSLSHLFPEELTAEQADALSAHLEKAARETPQCNKCGGFFKPGWGITSVDVSWGYNSTGKDTDRDKWKLCKDCSKEFQTHYDPICSLCRLSVVEVMAELSARNPHCTFYGDYKGALLHQRTNEHCGLEYATVAGRIVCEICYEKFISDFKIPIKAGSYDIGAFLYGEEEQRKNRIEESFAFRIHGDSLSDFYETWLTFDEVVAIRNMEDPSHRAIKLYFRESKPDMLAAHRKDDPSYEDKVAIQNGSGDYVRIPRSFFEKQSAAVDFYNLSIEKDGTVICFGDASFDAESIIEEFLGKDDEL